MSTIPDILSETIGVLELLGIHEHLIGPLHDLMSTSMQRFGAAWLSTWRESAVKTHTFFENENTFITPGSGFAVFCCYGALK